MAGDKEPEPDLGPVEIKEPWISFSIAFRGDKNSKAEFRAGLEAIVLERNELVHHFGAKWDQKSVASARMLLQQLDDQRARVIPQFERLQAMVQAMKDGMKDYAEALASPEAMHGLELQCLRQSPLVQMLCEFAASNARSDGWLSLDAARSAMVLRAPDQVASMKNRYGHRTLKALVIATDMFDLQDEPTARGSRTMYRLRPA